MIKNQDEDTLIFCTLDKKDKKDPSLLRFYISMEPNCFDRSEFKMASNFFVHDDIWNMDPEERVILRMRKILDGDLNAYEKNLVDRFWGYFPTLRCMMADSRRFPSREIVKTMYEVFIDLLHEVPDLMPDELIGQFRLRGAYIDTGRWDMTTITNPSTLTFIHRW